MNTEKAQEDFKNMIPPHLTVETFQIRMGFDWLNNKANLKEIDENLSKQVTTLEQTAIKIRDELVKVTGQIIGINSSLQGFHSGLAELSGTNKEVREKQAEELRNLKAEQEKVKSPTHIEKKKKKKK